MVRIGPDVASCRVRTRRQGVLQALGHDLELACQDFVLSFSPDGGRVVGVFQSDSLRVVGVSTDTPGDPVTLSEADRLTIERNIREDVLQSRRHPSIAFEAVGLRFDLQPEIVAGTLDLCGVRRNVAVRTRREGASWIARATVHQPDFGVEPFRIMLGGLRVHADVEVEITVPAERLSGIARPS